jgi:hypothetical protein
VHRSKARALRGICSAFGLFGAFAALVAGGSCSTRTVVVDTPVDVYVPVACGNAAGASVSYTGLGDFQPASDPTEVVPFGSSSVVLSQSAMSREIVLAPVTDAGPWAGAALVPDSGLLELLALPQNQACHFSLSVELDGNAGATLGMLDSTHALLLGGAIPGIPPFVVDLGTGIVTQVATASSWLRNYASVTPYGRGALIAGGESTDQEELGEVEDTAFVYTPGAGLGTELPLLAGQREKHAAVALPDGRTLLVGGVAGSTFVPTLEVLDPTSQTDIVLPAMVGRANPTVLVLPTGQVFIGGGTGAGGAPVTTLEWLTLPGLTSAGRVDLCSAGTAQGFAPTEEGAVLVVMGPGPGTATCSNVHLVRPPTAGSPPIVEEAPILDPPPQRIHMFQGAQASPVVVTDTSTLRWNPWSATFRSLGPNAAGLSVPTAALISASPGLALWLGEDDHLWALRFDTRGPYATDFVHPSDLDTDDLYTAPDRLVGADVSFSVATGAALAHGASVFVTDATYEGLTASVTMLQAGDVTFVLRDPLGQETTCTATAVAQAATVTLVRNGATVSLGVAGGSPSACASLVDAQARVAVGLRAPPTGMTVFHALTVIR